jgi:hypothetical protein
MFPLRKNKILVIADFEGEDIISSYNQHDIKKIHLKQNKSSFYMQNIIFRPFFYLVKLSFAIFGKVLI